MKLTRPSKTYSPSTLGKLVMGKEAIKAVFAAGTRQPRRLFIARGKEGEYTELLNLAREQDVDIKEQAVVALSERVGSDNHQGLLLLADPLPMHTLEEFTPQPGKPLLLLDHLEDPHNLGACIRSAAELGATAVIIPCVRAAPMSAATLKAASGAAEYIPLIIQSNMAQTLRQCQKLGWWAVGAAPDAKLPAKGAVWQRPVVIVIGGEDRGLSPLLANTCDELVHLPSTFGLTLNASVATALMLYEAVRYRQ